MLASLASHYSGPNTTIRNFTKWSSSLVFTSVRGEPPSNRNEPIDFKKKNVVENESLEL